MKGVILSGGLGTRLHPMTKVTNKHLLPVYDRPMILYPLETLKKSGISEIIIVCGREHAGHFMQFLGSGKEYGVKLSYALQDTNNGGIADALSYAEDFSDGGPVAVILGDNIFENHFFKELQDFKQGALIALKEIPDPERFGVAVFSGDGTRLLRIEEKPKKPKSHFAQTGFYVFDSNVYAIIKALKPSGRNELEITDAVNRYLENGALSFTYVRGAWLDAGTVESLFRSTVEVRKWRKKAP